MFVYQLRKHFARFSESPYVCGAVLAVFVSLVSLRGLCVCLMRWACNAHAGSRTRVTSMGDLYDAATLRAPAALFYAFVANMVNNISISRIGAQRSQPSPGQAPFAAVLRRRAMGAPRAFHRLAGGCGSGLVLVAPFEGEASAFTFPAAQ